MNEPKPCFKLPYDSPVEPLRLNAGDTLKFACRKGISCWNACCSHADVTLTPYDVIRLKQHTGKTSTELLASHTVPFELDANGIPGIKLRTTDDGACLFMSEAGCTAYQARPSACRYYPAGLVAMRKADNNDEDYSFLLVREEHCKGHAEDKVQTLQAYREDQELCEYDDYNREWYRIILKSRSSGPSIGKPSDLSLQLFFMVCYDVDRLRRFVCSDSFKRSYQLSADFYHSIKKDDVALMQFGFKLLNQVLYGEISIPEVAGARQKRLEQRAEILRIRRQVELTAQQRRNEQELASAVLGDDEVMAK
jgi:Fe-S-cluster containining protein